MGTAIVPVARTYDTGILSVEPAVFGEKLYSMLPNWQRATMEIISLEQMKANGNKNVNRDFVRNHIHETLGKVTKSHVVVGKILSEYCPDSPVCAEYNALGHKLPNKELLEKAQKILGFSLHPDKFPNNPEQQKIVTGILREAQGAAEFLKDIPRENAELHKAIIGAIKINPKSAEKMEQIFAELKGQKKPAQQAVTKALGKLKGKNALIAAGAFIGASAIYSGYKIFKDKTENKKDATGSVEYKGASETVFVAGQTEVDSNAGSFVGMVSGGALGAVIHDENKRIAAKENIDKIFDKSENFKEILNKLKKIGGKEIWANTSRLGKAAVIAIPAALVGNFVGAIVGANSGKKKYEEAKSQFDNLVAENKQLRTQLSEKGEATNTEHDNPKKSFVAAEDARRNLAASKPQDMAHSLA